MIFYLKEEFMSFDHFDIWDEQEQLVYSADREFFNFGRKLVVQDTSGQQVAEVQHVPFSLPCTYALRIGGREYDLTRNFALFSRSYSLDELGWEVEGDFMGLDYEITKNGIRVAAISRAFLTFGDRYALEIADPRDALVALTRGHHAVAPRLLPQLIRRQLLVPVVQESRRHGVEHVKPVRLGQPAGRLCHGEAVLQAMS